MTFRNRNFKEEMMKRKIVGIAGGLIPDTSGRFKDYWKSYVKDDYITSVLNAGGIPFIIPVNTDEDVIKEQLKHIDALIISGGDDVNPQEYGEEQLEKNGAPNIKRDKFDLILTKMAKDMKIPTLAICRGLQVANVAFGGTLYQDVSYMKNVIIKHDQWSNPDLPSHKVEVEKKTLLHEILGEKELWVNSFHHQAIKDLAKIFKVSAKSSDGVIEALEYIEPDYFFLAVQWHPEMMTAKGNEKMLKIFERLLKEAK